MTEILTITT